MAKEAALVRSHKRWIDNIRENVTAVGLSLEEASRLHSIEKNGDQARTLDTVWTLFLCVVQVVGGIVVF